jgi:hypothetical protein
VNIHNFLSSKGFSVDTFIYDGCLVKKKDGRSISQDIITACQEYVKEKTGFDVKLKVKPLTTSIVFNNESDSKSDIIDDDFAAEVFCNAMGDNIKVVKEQVWVFDEATGLWTDSETAIKRCVKKHKHKLMFEKICEDGKTTVINYGGYVNKIQNLLKFVGNYADIDDNFFNDNIDTSKGKLLFKNGIYDFDTDTFTEGFDPKIVFMYRIS